MLPEGQACSSSLPRNGQKSSPEEGRGIAERIQRFEANGRQRMRGGEEGEGQERWRGKQEKRNREDEEVAKEASCLLPPPSFFKSPIPSPPPQFGR